MDSPVRVVYLGEICRARYSLLSCIRSDGRGRHKRASINQRQDLNDRAAHQEKAALYWRWRCRPVQTIQTIFVNPDRGRQGFNRAHQAARGRQKHRNTGRAHAIFQAVESLL